MTRGEDVPMSDGAQCGSDRELLQRVAAPLPDSAQRAIRTAVADGALEGWSPTEEQLLRLAALAAGELTFSEYTELCISAPTVG